MGAEAVHLSYRSHNDANHPSVIQARNRVTLVGLSRAVSEHEFHEPVCSYGSRDRSIFEWCEFRMQRTQSDSRRLAKFTCWIWARISVAINGHVKSLSDPPQIRSFSQVLDCVRRSGASGRSNDKW